MIRTKLIAAIAAIGTTLVGGLSLALAQAGPNPPTAPVPAPQPSEMSAPGTQRAMTMSEQDARKTLENAGYTSIGNLEADEDGYTATATKDGRTIKLGVDHEGAIEILR